MTNKDIDILFHFALRPEMYTAMDKKWRIFSFVNGYEIGRNNKCNFSILISKTLKEDNNCCNFPALGWPGQISEFAEKENLTWETSFKKISMNVFFKYLEGKTKKKLQEELKLTIKRKIESIETSWFCREWINSWWGFVAVEEKWFKEIWTTKILEIIYNINLEIAKIEVKEQIIASRELVELAKAFKISQ